jgi:hypothetical protein
MADMIEHYRDWVVVYEGILPATLNEFNLMEIPKSAYTRR